MGTEPQTPECRAVGGIDFYSAKPSSHHELSLSLKGPRCFENFVQDPFRFSMLLASLAANVMLGEPQLKRPYLDFVNGISSAVVMLAQVI